MNSFLGWVRKSWGLWRKWTRYQDARTHHPVLLYPPWSWKWSLGPGQRNVKVVARSVAESASALWAVQQAARYKENQPAGRASWLRPILVSEVPTAWVWLSVQWSSRDMKPEEAGVTVRGLTHHYREVEVKKTRKGMWRDTCRHVRRRERQMALRLLWP